MCATDQAEERMKKSLYTERNQVLLEQLVAARNAANLAQQEVADLLGKPQSFVAKYESGDRRLDVVEFLEIADLIGFDAVKILKKIQSTS